MSSAHSFTNSDVFPGRCSPSHFALPTGLSLIPSLQVLHLLPELADFRSIFILFGPQVCVALGVLSTRFTPTTLVSAQEGTSLFRDPSSSFAGPHLPARLHLWYKPPSDTNIVSSSRAMSISGVVSDRASLVFRRWYGVLYDLDLHWFRNSDS